MENNNVLDKNVERADIDLKKEPWFLFGIISIVLIAILSLTVYFLISNNRIQIDDSQISASVVDIGPKTSGVLQEVYVKIGDEVNANAVLARVGTELLKTTSRAEVVKINNNIGEIFPAGSAVVSVVNPSELRVVGKIEEDKGLKDVRVGQRAVFTVDAFGGREFDGIVDEISPTSNTSDVVFSVSDKREQSSFNVKVRFDINKYPELKNGMSAKITIFKE